jgi:hypothetical protein
MLKRILHTTGGSMTGWFLFGVLAVLARLCVE